MLLFIFCSVLVWFGSRRDVDCLLFSHTCFRISGFVSKLSKFRLVSHVREIRIFLHVLVDFHEIVCEVFKSVIRELVGSWTKTQVGKNHGVEYVK